ncbi:MAG: electron transfer flavoprotein subunit beta/FixA family protein [Planctomycetaceae bacterium]
MNLVVCLKQILDPEIPGRDFRIDPSGHEAARDGAALVLNLFCANALETALQFRERHTGSITALSCGAPSVEPVLRQALALKADRACLVTSESRQPDPFLVARLLAAAIRKLGSVDIALVGRESGDWGWGLTGGLIAEELGWPCISFVDHFEPADARAAVIRVNRQTASGTEVIEAVPPVVLSITNNERNVPRIPRTRDVLQSSRRPIARWTVADLGLNPDDLPPASIDVRGLSIPEEKSSCEFVAGETLDERIGIFVKRILDVLRAS